eukprot:2287813-Rhodomonas_salina.1
MRLYLPRLLQCPAGTPPSRTTANALPPRLAATLFPRHQQWQHDAQHVTAGTRRSRSRGGRNFVPGTGLL